MRTVITYGTFDLFHQGHYNILKRAKEAGDYLIVGVTAESFDRERGKLCVRDSLPTRIENVRRTGFADRIIVEEYLGQKIRDIQFYNVDLLVVGSDWTGKFDHLKRYCDVVYVERTKNISSTMLREGDGKTLRYGIATDDLRESGSITEPKFVSGIHAESVYSRSQNVASEFCRRHELRAWFTDYPAFLDSADLVYIKSRREHRVSLVRQAAEAGKIIICDVPYTLGPSMRQSLMKTARASGGRIIENVTTLYLPAFMQLLWMARESRIGEIVSVRIKIDGLEAFGGSVSGCCDGAPWDAAGSPGRAGSYRIGRFIRPDFPDTAFFPVLMILKLLGTDITRFTFKKILSYEGRIRYANLLMEYKNRIASCEIGVDLSIGSGMEILGTEGSIDIPGNWWDLRYLEVNRFDGSPCQRYSFNLEGNGFRHLLSSVLDCVSGRAGECDRITAREAETVLQILKNAAFQR